MTAELPARVQGLHLKNYSSSLPSCALQEQLQDQVQTIQKLEDTVRQQAEDLNWTQSQLLSTQGSLIDLETHLTTLEDQQADEAAAASLQQPKAASAASSLKGNTQPAGGSASEKLQLKEDLLPSSPSSNDPVQAAFVNSIDSLFPPSGGDSEAGDMPDLPNDPYELFERGKAAVQARGANQNKDMADVPELHEDPYELFEMGKAAVESRAMQQNSKNLPKGKQRPSS